MRIFERVVDDVAELFPYLFLFYIFSLVIAVIFPTWKQFFYWPGFHGSIGALGGIALCGERGRLFFRGVSDSFHASMQHVDAAGRTARVSAQQGRTVAQSLLRVGVGRAHAVSGVGASVAQSLLHTIGWYARTGVDAVRISLQQGMRIVAEYAMSSGRAILDIVHQFIIRPLVLAVLQIHAKAKRADYVRAGAIIAVLSFSLTQGIDVASFGFLAFGLISILFLLDSRVSAGLALALLCVIPVLLLFGLEDYVEKLAVYAYYSLVITVGIEIAEYVVRGRDEAEDTGFKSL